MTQDGPLPPRPPLGERLDAQGRRLTARLVTTLPWAGPLHVFIDHASGLVVCGGRFDRIERDADRPPRLTATAVRRRPRPGVGPSPGGPPTPVPPSLPLPEAPAARRRRLYHRISRCPKLPRRNGRRPRPCHRTRATLCPPRSDRGCGRPSAPRPTLCGCTTTTSPARSRGNNGRMPSPSGGTSSSDTADCGQAEQSGFGLLVHEATHVLALLRPGASWHRATGAGARAEEAEALANERAAIFGGRSGAALPPSSTESGHIPDRHPSAPAQIPVPTAFSSSTARPQRAPTDRHTDVPATAPPPLDLQALRRNVIDDVIHQLRIEFERGG